MIRSCNKGSLVTNADHVTKTMQHFCSNFHITDGRCLFLLVKWMYQLLKGCRCNISQTQRLNSSCLVCCVMSKDILFYFFFQKYKIHQLNLVELTVSFIIIFFVAGKRGAEVTSTSPNKGTFSFWFYCCCNHQGFIFWPKENYIFLSKTKQEILSRQDYTVQVGI